MKDNFLSNDFTKYLDTMQVDLNEPLDVPLHCNIDINSDVWFEWMTNNWMDCTTLTYEPRPVHDATSNLQTELANQLGYHNGNTLKRDWGKYVPHHNDEFKEIIGDKNFERIGLDPDTVLVRLLCFLPGNIFPVHSDGMEGWKSMFNIDKDATRFSVFISPWSWGHYLQIHDNMLTNWKSGDTYIVPSGVMHCSGNGGILPKVTLTLTGLYDG